MKAPADVCRLAMHTENDCIPCRPREAPCLAITCNSSAASSHRQAGSDLL
ncbi:hypothetical protein L535_4869 [Bordetella bronchiseptica SBL-F6116]|nr:hypothetical protein L535_4869 [Bordetella bronchiseptica SBL-F6116]